MLIGGGKLSEFRLRKREQVLMQSRHDVEEVSNYAQTLNPLNLFWRGSQFMLGRLFLTDQRLILLPYSQAEVDKAHLLQNVSYKVLDKVGFGIPKPEINFTMEPIVIRLDEIHSLNPYERQFKIHPTLSRTPPSEAFDSSSYREIRPSSGPTRLPPKRVAKSATDARRKHAVDSWSSSIG